MPETHSMKFKIHRGTKEIGGSCVEVWTENTRILLDLGMPLVEKDGKDFDFNKYRKYNPQELIKLGILPNVDGLYEDAGKLIDGIIISHSHPDHYGFINFAHKKVKFFMGEATHKLIEINNLFTSRKIQIQNVHYFEKETPFQIGDFTITPYWADHSAFDAYSFLIESGGKSIFYSGDFRSHGRKAKAFKWFKHNAPENIDYLLLEGTVIGGEDRPSKTEEEIEDELHKIFQQSNKINLIYSSSQNIDRIVSVFKACLKVRKIFVVDVYVAKILKELSKFARLPHPSKNFEIVRVIFTSYECKKLTNEGNEKILFEFKHYKISKEEISSYPEKIVMMVRPSMQKDLERIKNIDGGHLIYSMWEGYLEKPATKKFMDYLESRNFKILKVHTGGHADIKTLKEMVKAVKPKNIVPIHTFGSKEYKNIFNLPVLEIDDGETVCV